MQSIQKLRPGDTVAILAPSSRAGGDTLQRAQANLQRLGLKPRLYPSCTGVYGYLSGSDAQRAADVQAAFADDSVQGIWCLRGGYGAQRLLPLLDLPAIARTPKFFAGFSDVTVLLDVFTQQCGFITYHMPMAGMDAIDTVDELTRTQVQRAMFHTLQGSLPQDDTPRRTLCPGVARGQLTGGNLTLVAALLGTPWELDTRGKVLFLEDTGEEPYRLDRMFSQLALAGKFRDAAGIVLGSFTHCESPNPQDSLTIDQVVQDLVASAGRPLMDGLCCGHRFPSLTLPMGATVELDADACTLRVLQDC